MDLARMLFDLVGVEVGGEVAEGVRLRGVSTELGLKWIVEVEGRELLVEVARVEEGGRFAARTGRLLLAYRAPPGIEVDGRRGEAVCKAIAARVKGREDEVLERAAREAAAAREGDEGAGRVREVKVERLLEEAGWGEEKYYTLSPYVGCLIGCRFCYAQTRVGGARRLQLLPEVPWGSYVDVRVNAAEVLERELERVQDRPVKFCPIVSDPYQAVEGRYRVTRGCLEVLARERVQRAVLVLTRSTLIARDLDILSRMERMWVGASVPTVDDEVRRHFEPRGAAIGERIELLGAMKRAGVRTFAVVQPILPGSIERLAEALAGVVSSVSIDVLRGVQGAKEEFADARFAEAGGEKWQRGRAEELRERLIGRGVEVWKGELPGVM